MRTYWCARCGHNSLQHFSSDEGGKGCVEKFIEYLEEFEHEITAIAHNMSSYDGHFKCKVLSQRSYECKMTMNGWKIMLLKFRNVRLNFLQMPLSKFVEVFNLPAELDKPFFPHLFNRPDRWSEQMGQEKQAKFNQWYDNKYNQHLTLICQWSCYRIVKPMCCY